MFVFKVPYDRGGGTKSLGARWGPDAIENAFRRYPWRGSEDGKRQEANFVEVEQKNAGPPVAPNIEAVLRSGVGKAVVLSGDNSVSALTVGEVAKVSADPHLVLIDAHPDICDFGHDAHASWVRKLWEDGIVRPEKTIFLGIRDAEEEEMLFLKEKGAKVFSSDDIHSENSVYFVDDLVFSGVLDVSSALILVVDIDVVDPSQAPGTGVLRAPGLPLRRVLRLINAFGLHAFPFKIGEITEIIPEKGNLLRPANDKRPDHAGLTVLAGEAILREMISSF